MAAYHRVYDCNLRADCLETGISSDPYARIEYGLPLPLPFNAK